MLAECVSEPRKTSGSYDWPRTDTKPPAVAVPFPQKHAQLLLTRPIVRSR
jgi:hypothetical protein